MAVQQKLEDITSKEYLDKALENAKKWCQENLPKYLHNFNDGFDYNIFHYIIDNKMIGPDMCLDDKISGLIRVSTRKLQHFQEREDFFREHGNLRFAKVNEKVIEIEGSVGVDPESMFIHEITESMFVYYPELLLYYLPKNQFPHDIAYNLENINRLERNLKPWPND